jgi:Protein of unknown function (DUF3000)
VATIETMRGSASAHPASPHVGTAEGVDALPPVFAAAVASVRAAGLHPDVVVEEVPPPRRVAPYALALDGHIDLESVMARTARPKSLLNRPNPAAEDEDACELTSDLADAGGRFVLLHDPARPEEWDGDQRVIALVKAVVEPELVDDPMMADVAWAWLVEELDAAGATCAELGGTVTLVSSRSFGALDGRRVELRASWTPTGQAGRHVQAWAAALCRLAGVPPVAAGVIRLPRR